jgi:hypothetical protein
MAHGEKHGARDDAFEVVEVVGTTGEAEVLVGLLQSESLDARIEAEDGGGVFPNFDAVEGVAIVVPSAQAARAREVLSTAEPLAEDEEPPSES